MTVKDMLEKIIMVEFSCGLNGKNITYGQAGICGAKQRPFC